MSGPPKPTTQRKTVMVVEDDSSVREMVKRALSASFTVVEAADGLIASEMLGHGATPDLMICDVMMPKIDGFSLVKLIRANPELSKMPIIFLTAKATPAAMVQGIQLGAKHYVQKPFSVKELFDKVAKILR